MNKKIAISLFAFLSVVFVKAQTEQLPVKEWKGMADSAFVLYLSGDGGMNDFSTSLAIGINHAGYSVAAVNAKIYFHEKKTAQQTATAIANYLTDKFLVRKNQQLILTGYSFGADVMPFVVNQLPAAMQKKIVSVILLSPSPTTDFETHLSDMLGFNQKRSMDVVAEINKMQVAKLAIINGSDETDFPAKNIKIENYSNEVLPGGHHFDGNTVEVTNAVMKYFR